MKVAVTAHLLSVALAAFAGTVEKRQAATSIDTLLKGHGKKFWGTCADQNRLTVSQDATITSADFGGVTPENSMKWDSIEPSQNQFNFAGADYLVNWATTNGKLIRGHTFVWAEQLPAWVTNINDKATLTSVLQNHITQVMTRYKGKLYAVDVVNEHINEDGTIKSTHWTQVLGNDVFPIAFKAARAVDPTVKLYINDYNLDSNNAKVQGIVSLVKSVNSANGQIIDGIGTQAHLSAGGAGGVQAALTALAGAGVDVAITELDIANAAASDYETVANACVAVPSCVSITSWGVRDPDSWRASTNPLLFDANWQPKPAYNGIVSVLQSGATGPTSTAGGGTPTTTSATTSPTVGAGTVAHWGQCGGQGWTGGTVCVAPYTCQAANAYYSQCL